MEIAQVVRVVAKPELFIIRDDNRDNRKCTEAKKREQGNLEGRTGPFYL